MQTLNDEELAMLIREEDSLTAFKELLRSVHACYLQHCREYILFRQHSARDKA